MRRTVISLFLIMFWMFSCGLNADSLPESLHIVENLLARGYTMAKLVDFNDFFIMRDLYLQHYPNDDVYSFDTKYMRITLLDDITYYLFWLNPENGSPNLLSVCYVTIENTNYALYRVNTNLESEQVRVWDPINREEEQIYIFY